MDNLGQLKDAARALRNASSSQKNAALLKLAQLLKTEENEILAANAKDIENLHSEFTPAFRDRLLLTPKRIQSMIQACEAVAALPDPVGEITETKTLKNGLVLKKTRSPFGVIFLIFESRPNVAIESFILAYKSGNGILLRAGKESAHTMEVFKKLLTQIAGSAVSVMTNPNRALVIEVLKQNKYVDLVIPRGGDALIEFVTENTKIPIIKNDRGLCHTYIHEDADLEMALSILNNAKTQRPGVCNATETVLVHEKIANIFLPRAFETLSGVEFYCDSRSYTIIKKTQENRLFLASENSFDTEYLDLKINCKIVSSLYEALQHIEEHGSKHSECIVSSSEKTAHTFQSQVDAAAVYWNASTRFTDGAEFGLGGEIGISTQKLHVRGPVGLRELTCEKWVIDGNGQIRN